MNLARASAQHDIVARRPGANVAPDLPSGPLPPPEAFSLSPQSPASPAPSVQHVQGTPNRQGAASIPMTEHVPTNPIQPAAHDAQAFNAGDQAAHLPAKPADQASAAGAAQPAGPFSQAMQTGPAASSKPAGAQAGQAPGAQLPGSPLPGAALSATALAESMVRALMVSMGPTAVANWIQPSARFEWQAEQGVLVVWTPSRFMADFLDRKFGQALQQAAEQTLVCRLTVSIIAAPERFAPGAAPTSGIAPGIASGISGKTSLTAPAASQANVDDPAVAALLSANQHLGQAAAASHASQGMHGLSATTASHAAADGRLKPAFGPSAVNGQNANGFAAGVNGHRPGLSGGRARHGIRRNQYRHKLEDYVVGASNELAYSAAMLLAHQPEQAPSPLFLHGGCGLGKTHLLQGICRQTVQANPQAKVLYTTGESFTNAYIQAVTTGKIDAFRAKHRGLDLLAIDDVHFIAGKKKTQAEFYHCIDQLIDGGAKIVLASDSHPRDIAAFTEAMVSRCIAGLVAEVRPLSIEGQIELALQFAARRGLRMPRQVAERLASHYGQSARDLEGAITKLQAMSLLNPAHAAATPTEFGSDAPTGMAGRTLADVLALTKQNGNHAGPAAGFAAPSSQPAQHTTMPRSSMASSGASGGGGVGHLMVDRLLAEEQGQAVVKPVSFEELLAASAEVVGVSVQQLMSKTRVRPVVLARDIVVHLARQMTSMSYPEIARALGRSNHSTVITAAQRFEKQLAENADWLVPAQPGQAVRLATLVEQVRSPRPRK